MNSTRLQFRYALAFAVALGATWHASAGQAEIEFAELIEDTQGWRINVTLRHADTGWGHYAKAWRILDEHGKLLGERTLYHPHVNEQPFTRSLNAVAIPAGTQMVFIEAQDSMHGVNAQRLRIDMRQRKGAHYEVRPAQPRT